MPDTNLQITGETGEARDENGRFLRGYSGNPAGRPRGSLNRATLTAALLLDDEAEALTRKAVEMALAGDAAALRLCLDRIIGRRRGRPVDLALPPIDTADDLAGAAIAVADAAAQGTVTPQEALALTHTLQSCGNHLTRWRLWDGRWWRSLVNAGIKPAAAPAGGDRRIGGWRIDDRE